MKENEPYFEAKKEKKIYCLWKGCIHYKHCPLKINREAEGCSPHFHIKCPMCGRKVYDVPEIKIEKCDCGWSMNWRNSNER